MEVSTYPLDTLAQLNSTAIIELGIGGYIAAEQIARVFNPMSAEEFARITYATDLMSHILDDPAQAVNVENVAAVIEQNQFDNKPHFNELVELFRAKFNRRDQVQFR